MFDRYVLARFLGTFIDAKKSPDDVCPYWGEKCTRDCGIRCQISIIGKDSVSLMTWGQWFQYLFTGPRPEPLGRWWARGAQTVYWRTPRVKTPQ